MAIHQLIVNFLIFSLHSFSQNLDCFEPLSRRDLVRSTQLGQRNNLFLRFAILCLLQLFLQLLEISVHSYELNRLITYALENRLWLMNFASQSLTVSFLGSPVFLDYSISSMNSISSASVHRLTYICFLRMRGSFISIFKKLLAAFVKFVIALSDPGDPTPRNDFKESGGSSTGKVGS